MYVNFNEYLYSEVFCIHNCDWATVILVQFFNDTLIDKSKLRSDNIIILNEIVNNQMLIFFTIIYFENISIR